MPSANRKIYGTTTMNEKGQIVIPVEARNMLGLEPGTRLMIMGAPFDGAVIVIKTELVETRIQSLTQALNEANEENT